MAGFWNFVFADNTKSGKREVANLIMLMWGIVYFKLFFFTDAGPLLDSQKDLFKDLNPWMLGFVAAAYGLDFWMKAQNAAATKTTTTTSTPSRPSRTLPAD